MLDTQLKYLGSNKNKTKMYSKNLKLRPCNSEIGYIYNIFLWMEIFLFVIFKLKLFIQWNIKQYEGRLAIGIIVIFYGGDIIKMKKHGFKVTIMKNYLPFIHSSKLPNNMKFIFFYPHMQYFIKAFPIMFTCLHNYLEILWIISCWFMNLFQRI